MTFFRPFIRMSLALGLVACTQLQVQQMNEAAWQKEYNEHLEWIAKGNRKWQSGLQKAVRAAWVWEAEGDFPDEVKLPAPIKLSDEEFKNAVSILRQARPMPALPESEFRRCKHYVLNEEGKIMAVVRVNHHGCCGGCCGEGFARYMLAFYDEQGKVLCAWDDEEIISESEIKDWDKSTSGYRPTSYLPDSLYAQLLRLPSAMKAKEIDSKLQTKLKNRHRH